MLAAFNGCSRAASGWLRGRAVLLVDDVFTAGATAFARARALKAGVAARVSVLTLAHATQTNDLVAGAIRKDISG
jgi:predicted amidophosphoribosyltransferase